MQIRTVAMFISWLAYAFFASAANALECGDNLLGDYATGQNKPAVLRIEKIYGKLVSRTRTDDGMWASKFDEVRLISREDLQKSFDNEKLTRNSCGLGVAGIGMLLKLPIGVDYQVSSPTEKSMVSKKVKSGYLAYLAQGFAVSAVELYPVRHQGDSPTPPAPLLKATVGREVPTTAICPGNRVPDMTQAGFNALPVAFRTWFREQEAKSQLRFTCGQYLSGLMRNHRQNYDYDYSFEELGPKREQLDVLLSAKQIPRDAEGRQSWRFSTWFLLMRNHENQGGDEVGAAPIDPKLYVLYDQKIFPNLDTPASDDNDPDLLSLIHETLYMPDEIGLKSLKKFNAGRVLQQQSKNEEHQNNATRLLRATGLSKAKFDYLLKEAGPGAINNASLMEAMIVAKNTAGIERLLAVGANPAHDGLLAAARVRNPAIYQMLLRAALRYASAERGFIASIKLPATEARLILKSAVQECDKIDWNEVDFLLTHGADLSDFGNNRSVAYFAFKCPEGFKTLVRKGLPLNSRRASEKYKDGALMEYLNIDSQFTRHRADVVATMLAQHNDLEECNDCAHYALVLGIDSDDPEIPKVMLNYGANPNRMNPYGQSPFLVAVFRDRVDLLDLMQSKTKLKINALDKEGISPLAWAKCVKAAKSVAWLNRQRAVTVGYDTCTKKLKNQQKQAESE